MGAPLTIRQKVMAEINAAHRAAGLKGKPAESPKFSPTDVDFHFHGKPSATFIVRGEPRTLKFGEEFNRKTDMEVFVAQLIEELLAKDEAAARKV